MQRKFKNINSLFILFYLIGCQSISKEEYTLDVINGVEVNPSDFPETVQIRSVSAGVSASCSATLINQTTIVTAAHCIVSGINPLVTMWSNGASTTVMATHVEVNRNWTSAESNGVNGNDLAVLTIPRDLVVRRHAQLCPSIANDKYVDMVGFGCDGFDASTRKCATMSTSRKRWGGNVIRVTPRPMISIVGGSKNGSIAPADARHTFSIPLPGDSGGGLFTTVEGLRCLIGVTSGFIPIEGDSVWESKFVNLNWQTSLNFIGLNAPDALPPPTAYLNRTALIEPFSLVETFVSIDATNQAILLQPSLGSTDSNSAFRVVPGLGEPSCNSFMLNGNYLHVGPDSEVKLAANNGTTAFSNESTFCARRSPNHQDWLTFESLTSPRFFLKADGGKLRLLSSSGASRTWMMDASFRFLIRN